jgi:hypothetical protein
VISESRLVDDHSNEHVYWRRDGRPLAPGYYLVSLPAGTARRRFNEDAAFRGPYRQRTDALTERATLASRPFRIS